MVATGAFAPGHLGELTRIIPFEMVDAVLESTRAVQARVRALPSRVVVYLLLAAVLFAELGYEQVWARMTAGLAGVPVADPVSSALSQARRRIGIAPLRALFDLIKGPAAGAARWRGLLVCAIDGTSMFTPDSPANVAAYGHAGGGNGPSGYPMLRLLAVVACGTRTVIDAVFGTPSVGEITYAPPLLGCLGNDMLLLADRNFAAADLIGAVAGTGADLLFRCRNNRKLPMTGRCGDNSWLTRIGTTTVRVIAATILVHQSGGPARTERYLLITTLTDHKRYPAPELVSLYHQRWEIETSYLELKSTILGGRVLRARTPDGIAQEIYALLITYQALRIAITDATVTTGTTPDRASFSIALNTARDQLILAAGIIAGTTIDLIGTIGHAVLDHLLPARRQRTCPRIVKRAISKHRAKGNIDRNSYKITINITINSG
ncbi:IS4 family transposase [Nocardia sp. CA-129566]|uniref:IS4 family transposase n=1 Tax=Nocardia sp. CA-129566 TaxID=3239976 RepID=UPI003D98879E